MPRIVTDAVSNRLNPSIGPDSLFYPAIILLDHVVQILAGSLNPMDELRLGTEHEVGDVQNLALLLVDPNGRGVERGDHRQKTAYSLLVGCICTCATRARSMARRQTLASLIKCWPIRAGQSRISGTRCLPTLTSTERTIRLFLRRRVRQAPRRPDREFKIERQFSQRRQAESQ
jgi:Type IV secretory system Conjugative DNA transfer